MLKVSSMDQFERAMLDFLARVYGKNVLIMCVSNKNVERKDKEEEQFLYHRSLLSMQPLPTITHSL